MFYNARFALALPLLSMLGALSFGTFAGDARKRDEPNRGGTMDLASMDDPNVELERFKLQDGYKIELFASEKQFPELQKPLAMAFDAKGRLWVTTMPSYPHYLPPNKPNDKILILEDTHGDGKADKCSVFADGLYLPTGIEMGLGGVYVGGQPNLLFLKDTNGGDKADTREIVVHGLGTEDSHHAVHAFYWAPDGGLLFHEGIFHHSQVETPYGPMRLADSGSMRFYPRTGSTSVFVTYGFANPWGHIYDRWGQNFIADASGGSNYFGSAITGFMEHPDKHKGMKVFTSVVRPTCGCVLVSSRHFPDEAQGNFLVNNNIGFQGTKQHKVSEEASGFTSKEIEPLINSSDPNFRPVAIRFAPDGSLYIVDWCNPLIGHMQYSLRDERRDHTHGRIWRITYPSRPLVKAPKIDGASTAELLELLKVYEDDTRYRARRELNARNRDEVTTALKKWIAELDPRDEQYEHNLLEGLWIYQTVNVVEPELLNKLLNAKEPRARAAATRALRYWMDRINDPMAILRKQVQDEFPRVRLEALLTLSFMKNAEAAEVALQALNKPTDYYLDYVLSETMRALEKYWKPAIASGKPFAAVNPAGLSYVLNQISVAELNGAARSKPVYDALLTREGVANKERREALSGLAKLNGTSDFVELAGAIGNAKDAALADLAEILAQWDPAVLASSKELVTKLATMKGDAAVRRAGLVAMIRGDNSVEGAWKLAGRSARDLAELLRGVPMLNDAKLLEALYPKTLPLLAALPPELDQQPNKSASVRFIRIELPGPQRTLSMAEVEVFSNGKNIALKGKARQSSTQYGAGAERAIDGKTAGAFGAGSCMHTEENQPNPWWEVDLGAEQHVEKVVVWNRTEEQARERISGFTLLALDSARSLVTSKTDIPAPKVSESIELNEEPLPAVRRAAIVALSKIPGHESEIFNALSDLAIKNMEIESVIRTLSKMKQDAWPKEKLMPLGQALATYCEKVPLARRDTPDYADALALGRYLASKSTGPDADALRAKLRSAEVQIVTIKTIEEQMRYDVTQFYVEADRPVEIIFENPDVMQHNLIVVEPGALSEVGQAAEAMGGAGFAKNFIPESPKILFKTALIAPKTTERMHFKAPAKPGDYPFLCTFPGHWIIMNGLMTVVPKDDPKAGTVVTQGQRAIEKLPPISELAQLSGDPASGKTVFESTCVICHKIGNLGVDFGPNLSQVGTRLAKDKIFESILTPDAVVDPKFQNVIFKMNDGKIMTGIVAEEVKDVFRVKTGGEHIEEIKKSEIQKKAVQKTSPMPTGLEQKMTKQQLVDLVEYLSKQR